MSIQWLFSKSSITDTQKHEQLHVSLLFIGLFHSHRQTGSGNFNMSRQQECEPVMSCSDWRSTGAWESSPWLTLGSCFVTYHKPPAPLQCPARESGTPGSIVMQSEHMLLNMLCCWTSQLLVPLKHTDLISYISGHLSHLLLHVIVFQLLEETVHHHHQSTVETM